MCRDRSRCARRGLTRYCLTIQTQPGGVRVIAQQPSSVEPRTELTVRGLIIGILITLVFTAANVFFGLKAGLTFATSIPAAVISMAILRKMRDSTMQENNIVQTVASAAGTLSKKACGDTNRPPSRGWMSDSTATGASNLPRGAKIGWKALLSV